MQTGFIIAGILFFLNPNVEIIDILPDFIGCALLLWGTRRLCACSEKGAAAGKAFRILLLLNLAKTISLLLFFIISESEMTWMLLLTSVFGILEAALFLYGLQMLHDTVLFTAMLHGKDGVYGKAFSAFFGMARLFTVLKCLFSILPELTFLVTDYGDVKPVETDWSFLFRLLTAVNIFVVTLFGILLLILTLRFFRSLAKEEADYLACLREDYRLKIENVPGVLPYKRLRWSALLLSCGMLFFLPLRLDGIDILPDFAGAGLLIAAALLMKKEYPKPAKRASLWLLALGTVSAIEWTGDLLLLFSTGYSILNADLRLSYAQHLSLYLYRDPDAYFHFLLLLIPTALRCILFPLSVISFCRLLRAAVLDHTGAPVEDGDDAYLRSVAVKKTEAIHRKLSLALTLLSVLGGICALFSFLSKALLLRELPFPLWLPEFLLFLLAAVGFRVFTYSLADNMDRKYYYSEYI